MPPEYAPAVTDSLQAGLRHQGRVRIEQAQAMGKNSGVLPRVQCIPVQCGIILL